MLSLGDRAGGGERGGVGGGGGGGMNESYVMDGYKDNDVISIAYKCLSLWPISIISGAYERTGQGTKGGVGGGRGRR